MPASNNSNAHYMSQTTQESAPNSQPNSGVRNGLAQPINPMESDVNLFDVMDMKNGNHFTQQSAPNTTPQGFPQGTQQMQAPQASGMVPQSEGSTEGASPMDKWFKPVDNGTVNSADGTQPPAQSPATPPTPPAAYESVFAKAKFDEYQAMIKNQNFVGELFNDDMAAAFKEGDFSSLPTMLNAAIQQGAAMAAFMSGKVADKGMSGMFDNFQQNSLPQLLNNHQMDSMWQNPEFADFSSPAMQPMVAMATNHVKGMFPNASPQEVQSKAMEMMRDYSKQMASMSFAPKQQSQTPDANVESLTDLERLFNSNPV